MPAKVFQVRPNSANPGTKHCLKLVEKGQRWTQVEQLWSNLGHIWANVGKLGKTTTDKTDKTESLSDMQLDDQSAPCNDQGSQGGRGRPVPHPGDNSVEQNLDNKAPTSFPAALPGKLTPEADVGREAEF